MKLLTRRWLLAATALTTIAAAGVGGSQVLGGSGGEALAGTTKASANGGLGPISGLLPRDHLTEESAIQVDLSKESVRLPLYKGKANGKTVWYVLLDASDQGIAHDLGVNYAPKLGNIGIGCPDCVQTVTLDSPSPDQNRFGQAVVNFQGAPDFGPTRIAEPGPNGFPLAKFQPGAVAGNGYSPFVRIAGSPTVYSAPIVATGDGPFDVVHHTNTGDRVLGIHIAGPSAPGQYAESWVDLLFVKGFDAGRPIVYISTDAGQPLTSVLERSTYVPALDKAAYNGGDDFLGSARERLFGFINGQTGPDNKQSQGFVHLVKDGHASEDASANNTALIDALRKGRRPAQRVRRLPHPRRPTPLPGLQPAVGRPAGPVDRQGGQARAQQAPDRRGTGLQPRRHPPRPADRRGPGDRQAGSLRRGRRRHQLRGDRVHRQGPHGQPRRPGREFAVPTALTHRTAATTADRRPDPPSLPAHSLPGPQPERTPR
jgi:hypothetical protein